MYETKNNKATLQKANAAITKGDNEGFLSYCTDDTTWTFVGDNILPGKEAVRQWMKTAYAQPPNFTVENLISEDDLVVALGKIWLKDDSREIVEYSYCDIWRFRDGKIAGLNGFVIKTDAR